MSISFSLPCIKLHPTFGLQYIVVIIGRSSLCRLLGYSASSLWLLTDVHETPTLEDDDDDFGLIPPSIATTTAATSEQSTESCDTSPGLVSPAISRCSEDLSEPQDTPTSDWPAAELRDEGPDSVPAE